MTEYLGDRRKALEESFFAKHEHKLREEIRAQKEKEDGMQALAANCGVKDAGVLETCHWNGHPVPDFLTPRNRIRVPA